VACAKILLLLWADAAARFASWFPGAQGAGNRCSDLDGPGLCRRVNNPIHPYGCAVALFAGDELHGVWVNATYVLVGSTELATGVRREAMAHLIQKTRFSLLSIRIRGSLHQIPRSFSGPLLFGKARILLGYIEASEQRSAVPKYPDRVQALIHRRRTAILTRRTSKQNGSFGNTSRVSLYWAAQVLRCCERTIAGSQDYIVTTRSAPLDTGVHPESARQGLVRTPDRKRPAAKGLFRAGGLRAGLPAHAVASLHSLTTKASGSQFCK